MTKNCNIFLPHEDNIYDLNSANFTIFFPSLQEMSDLNL